VTMVGSECYFLNIIRMHAYLMVSWSQVQFGEVLSAF
jgi:hypothetical protein